MFRRIVAVLVALSLIIVPTVAFAESPLDGKVYSIEKDERAPYAGILLDGIAASKMITDKKYLRTEIELELRKEFQIRLSDTTLNLELIKADYEALKKIHTDTLALRDQEIKDLNNALKEEMEDYSHAWFAGGMVIGILVSIGVFFAAAEAVK